MNDDLDARLSAMNQTRRLWTRRAPHAVSVGLLMMATMMGVHLGLDGPAVSPVSPAAITARYGAPPTGVPVVPPVVEQVMLLRHEHGQHDGGRNE